VSEEVENNGAEDVYAEVGGLLNCRAAPSFWGGETLKAKGVAKVFWKKKKKGV